MPGAYQNDPVLAKPVLAPETPAISAPPVRRLNWGKWGVVLAVVLLVTLPVAWAHLPREMARWELAKAQGAFLHNDLAGMQEALSAALHYDPESWLARVEGANWHLELGDAEGALPLINEALEMAPDEYEAYQLRSMVYQKLGRHAEAVADSQRFLERVRERASREAMGLNGVAYSRAVGNVELPEALAQIEQAIKLDAPREAYLDTRGFIQYLMGNLAAARTDLDEAVAKGERAVQEGLARIDRNASQVGNAEAVEYERKKMRRILAVMYYHRALVLEKQGEKQAAERDLARVRELGCEPGPDLY